MLSHGGGCGERDAQDVSRLNTSASSGDSGGASRSVVRDARTLGDRTAGDDASDAEQSDIDLSLAGRDLGGVDRVLADTQEVVRCSDRGR